MTLGFIQNRPRPPPEKTVHDIFHYFPARLQKGFSRFHRFVSLGVIGERQNFTIHRDNPSDESHTV